MVFGKVKVNPIVIGVWGFFVFADGSIYAPLVILAALLHEGAHMIAIRAFDAGVEQVAIQPFGVNIKIANRYLSYQNEVAVAAAGPLGSLLLGAFAALLYFCVLPQRAVIFFAAVNLALFTLNMLPIEFLDGGRMLKNALLLEFMPDTVGRVLQITTIGMLIPLSVAGFCMLAKSSYNFSLVLLSLYLLFLFIYKS